MNVSQYNVSLNKILSFLKRNSLSKKCVLYHSQGVSEKADLRMDDRDYALVYREIIEKHDYDILLFDDSVIQFDYLWLGKVNKIRYIYYQMPYEFPTYNQYLEDAGFNYLEVGETFRQDYEQELSEAAFKKAYVYMRYEFSSEEYVPGIHPSSHLHIGPYTTIRIPISKIVTPYLFVMFVLKQAYYKNWKLKIQKNDFYNSYKVSKRSCSNLGSSLFCEKDKIELYMI